MPPSRLAWQVRNVDKVQMMASARRQIEVAIVQAPPIPLAIGLGLEDLVVRASELSADNVKLIAFGESFIGGYPLWFDAAPDAALWQAPGAKALHRILLRQALVDGDERLAPLQDLVDTSGALVSFGAHERVRKSLFNTQYLMRPGQPPLLHRKLVPTHGERLLWARGDGATMAVHQEPWGRVGSLICWEHWMPLARAAMHNQSESIHVAAWPSLGEMHLIASCHYAFEGRCFVMAAATIQHRDDLFEGLAAVGGDPAAHGLFSSMPNGRLQDGGSAIIAPDGTIVARADASDMVIRATLDLDLIEEELTTLDTDGHYARPDIFRLNIDRNPQIGVE